MAVKASPAARAPRGTKILTQAFFSAADGIPEAQRDAVVKAALNAIRDQLKETRNRAKLARAKTREKSARAVAAPAQKPSAAAPPAKPRAKRAPKPAAETGDDADMT